MAVPRKRLQLPQSKCCRPRRSWRRGPPRPRHPPHPARPVPPPTPRCPGWCPGPWALRRARQRRRLRWCQVGTGDGWIIIQKCLENMIMNMIMTWGWFICWVCLILMSNVWFGLCFSLTSEVSFGCHLCFCKIVGNGLILKGFFSRRPSGR